MMSLSRTQKWSIGYPASVAPTLGLTVGLLVQGLGEREGETPQAASRGALLAGGFAAALGAFVGHMVARYHTDQFERGVLEEATMRFYR